ncbi:hypothetical protein NGM99_13995 [Mesorhizobium sp. RP14(2022)]|uniref:GcrA cell cycle regulator n=1 Tax=Mesorhizobium liriopis TaxID=2953882 RepID=A0ABT1C7S7_9HYPH|nr:hypothetical protein [Mesorhizobium liriopis]MCO6050892.1 hypothetical protein [Mesorhizobium liriopis]
MREKPNTNAVPNPGSDAALVRGCTCPVLDNAHGKGAMGNPDRFWYTVGCPVHVPAASKLGGGDA